MNDSWVSSGKKTQDVSVVAGATGSSGGDGAIVDGANATIKATVKDLLNSNPLTVAITDANGDQITSFGGGIQYTEGDVDASITGTALMMEGAGNTLVSAQGTVADGLLVNLGANNDVTVTGTVTASAQPGVDIGDVTINNAAGASAVNIQDGGNSITVDGTVGISGSVAVTGTFWQATQPVSVATVPSHDVTNAGTFVVQNTEQGTTSVGSGAQNVTTAGTRVQLGAQACKWLTIQAKSTNTDGVIIGGSTVLYSSLNGYVLFPSQSITLKISNLNLIYVDSAVSGEGISYIYGN